MQLTQRWSVVSHELTQQSASASQPPLSGLQWQKPNSVQSRPSQHGLLLSHVSPGFRHGGGGVVVVVVDVVVEVVVVEVVVVGNGSQNSLGVPGFLHWDLRQQTSFGATPQHSCCSSKTSQHS
jgi:hypothetical protein